MACHSFVSHVTGFATMFGVEINQNNLRFAAGALMVPVFFLIGAMISGVLVDMRLKLHKKPAYYLVFGVMFVLLLGVVIFGFNGFFGRFGEPLEQRHDYTLLAVLCLVCGIQNGTVTLVSRAIVRTTHLTGLTTDLGIGLVRVLNARRIAIGDEGKANMMRVGIILSFILGSGLGYRIFENHGFRGFLLPCVLTGGLFILTWYFQVRHQLSSSQKS